MAAQRRVRMTTVLNGGDIPPTADGTGLEVAPQPTAISKQLAESAHIRKRISGVLHGCVRACVRGRVRAHARGC